MKEIYIILRRMGLTTRYKGYYFTVEAVNIYLESENLPVMITKDIYPIIARKYKIKPKSVERAIRTVVEVSWKNGREEMKRIAGYPLEEKPTNKEFLDIISFAIWRLKNNQSFSKEKAC